MCNKILAAATVLIGLLLGILAMSLPVQHLKPIIEISRFFEVMIPVLAVGALLRYLTHCPYAHTMNTVTSACFIFIAVVLGILAVVLPVRSIEIVILISRFFEIMLPVFAVGALIKFLTCCPKSCDKKD